MDLKSYNSGIIKNIPRLVLKTYMYNLIVCKNESVSDFSTYYDNLNEEVIQ